jgi:HTH-type transcriptional regulator, competence development regulator
MWITLYPSIFTELLTFRSYWCLVLHNSIHRLSIMAKTFGETVRQMREAQDLGLRAAAEQLEISPAYLSRIERGKEKPPRPELIGRMARLLGGDSDLLFRLSQSTDPELAEYVNSVPKLPEFLRSAMAAGLTSEDFDEFIKEIQKRSSSTRASKGKT